jgi:Zn-dependent protease
MLIYVGAPVFGYARPVPVRLSSLGRFRRAHILISAAGPAANLAQAAVCLALLMFLGSVLAMVPGVTVQHLSDFEPIVEVSGIVGSRVLASAALMLKMGFGINVLLAFFNLIPVPPLDGSWILEHLFPNTLGRVYAAIRPYGFLLFLLLIWSDTPILAYLMLPALIMILTGQGLIYSVTGF